MSAMRAFHLLQVAHSALFRAADALLRAEHGVTASQQAVLFSLLSSDGAPISHIADELRMGKSSLTALIDRMEQAGLVRRVIDADDARVSRIHITPPGARVASETLVAAKAANRRLLAPFSADEQDVIERFLRHAADNAHRIIAPPKRKSSTP
jgi:DNA-binding MarR family transcriptional regulator